jgi:hypothetical protein
MTTLSHRLRQPPIRGKNDLLTKNEGGGKSLELKLFLSLFAGFSTMVFVAEEDGGSLKHFLRGKHRDRNL